jgi:hypothetical protein
MDKNTEDTRSEVVENAASETAGAAPGPDAASAGAAPAPVSSAAPIGQPAETDGAVRDAAASGGAPPSGDGDDVKDAGVREADDEEDAGVGETDEDEGDEEDEDEEDEDEDDEDDEEDEYVYSVGQVKGDSLRIFVVLFGLGLFLAYGFSYLNASNASEMYLGNVKYSFQFFGVLALFVMLATILENLYARRRYKAFFRDDGKKLAFELIMGLQFFLTIGVLGGGIAVLTYVLTTQ